MSTCRATEPFQIRGASAIAGEGVLYCELPEGHDGHHETHAPTIMPDGGTLHLFQNAQKRPATPAEGDDGP